ncbi:MAG: glycosyltransferase [Puniceicoccaceae bacterium]
MARVFVDATATARTLHHTGVQRIVREMLAAGAGRAEEWRPVVRRGGAFRRPSRLERLRLERIFSPGPHRWRGTGGWVDALFPGGPVRIPAGEADARFLLPEIPGPERIRAFGELLGAPGRRIRVVGFCHDVFSWSHPEWTPGSRREGFADFLRLLCRMDRVVCPSRETASEWLRFRAEEGLDGPVPEVRPWPIPAPAPAAGPPPPGRPLVLSVGTLEVRKNHAALLDAAESLWADGLDFELVLVGRKRAAREDGIVRRVRALRASGRPARWHARIPDAALDDLHRRAAFTVFPSLGEGFGLPVAESLARGRPCVCSGAGAVGEIAAGGGCVPVRVESPGALADGMRKLLADPRTRDRLAREAAARRWITWPEWLEGLLSGADGC